MSSPRVTPMLGGTDALHVCSDAAAGLRCALRDKVVLTCWLEVVDSLCDFDLLEEATRCLRGRNLAELLGFGAEDLRRVGLETRASIVLASYT